MYRILPFLDDYFTYACSDYFFDYLLVTHVLKRLYPRCFHSLLAHREVAGSNPVTPIFLYSREQ